MSHVVIKVLVSQIVFSRKIDPTTFALWTLNARHFLIKLDSEMPQLNDMFQKVAESAVSELPPTSFLMKISDLTHAFQKWNAPLITSEQLLLIVNGLRGNMFADLKSFPYFPVRFSKENPVAPKGDDGTIASLLRAVSPFGRFITVAGNDDDDSGSSGSPESEDLWFPRQRKLSRKISYPTVAIFEHFVKMESIGYSSESCPAVFYYCRNCSRTSGRRRLRSFGSAFRSSSPK
jgi:hypothetical protein